jgi:opacity protein-like surface antigen
LKARLILITVLMLGAMAHAQGFGSHVSFGLGLEGIFPAATFKNDVINQTSSTQSTTNSVGAVGSVRFDFGHHSAIDISVTANRNSERFFNNGAFGSGGFLTRVQTNNFETIVSYIFRLPASDFIKPYALLGGGAVRFSPNNAFTTAGVPQSETKPAFAYGFGADFPFGDHLALRLQYRGLIRSSPDFKLSAEPFGTGLKTHVPEPSVQIVYHF